MASLSTCHLGIWLGWQILLNLVKYFVPSGMSTLLVEQTTNTVVESVAYHVSKISQGGGGQRGQA